MIRVAVHDEPLRGKDIAAFLFGVLTQELTPFKLVGEIVEGSKSVVLFETSLRGQRGRRTERGRMPARWPGRRLDRVLPSARGVATDRPGDRWSYGAAVRSSRGDAVRIERILVVGGTGLIGAPVARRLLVRAITCACSCATPCARARSLAASSNTCRLGHR